MRRATAVAALILATRTAQATAFDPTAISDDGAANFQGVRARVASSRIDAIGRTGEFAHRGLPAPGDLSLIIAVSRGDVVESRALLSRGANANARDDTAQTPLDTAVRAGNPELVRELLRRGADADALSQGTSPLALATQRGELAIVRLLLDAGARIDDIDGSGRTPLLQAIAFGRTTIALLMIDRGADVNRADLLGETPLQAARAHREALVIDRLSRADARSTTRSIERTEAP